jgi:hypothetical protein
LTQPTPSSPAPAEEAGVLQRLRAINPSLLQRLCCRLFFVVNKVRAALLFPLAGLLLPAVP